MDDNDTPFRLSDKTLAEIEADILASIRDIPPTVPLPVQLRTHGFLTYKVFEIEPPKRSPGVTYIGYDKPNYGVSLYDDDRHVLASCTYTTMQAAHCQGWFLLEMAAADAADIFPRRLYRLSQLWQYIAQPGDTQTIEERLEEFMEGLIAEGR